MWVFVSSATCSLFKSLSVIPICKMLLFLIVSLNSLFDPNFTVRYSDFRFRSIAILISFESFPWYNWLKLYYFTTLQLDCNTKKKEIASNNYWIATKQRRSMPFLSSACGFGSDFKCSMRYNRITNFQSMRIRLLYKCTSHRHKCWI